MAEQIPQPPEQQPPPAPPTDLPTQPVEPTPPPRRRRRWPWVVGGLVVLLLLLVAFLPQIASTGMVRNIVLSRLNANLNGTVTVDSWKLAWTGGTHVRGLQIKQDGAQILQIENLTTQLSLAGVVRGNYFTYGKTTVDGLSFTLVKYEDGTTNFDRLLKTQQTSAPPPAPTKQPTGETLLPNLSGDFEFTFWGTIDDRQLKKIVTIDKSRATAQVDDINNPIPHNLDLALRVDGKGPGRLIASGKLDAVEGNKLLDATQIKADEDLEVRDLEWSSIAGFLDLPDVKQFEGVSNGKLTIRATDPDRPVLAGNIETRDVAVGGPLFQGNTYRTPTLSIAIPNTTFDRTTQRLRIGSGSPGEMLQLKVEEGTVTLSADASVEALRRAFTNQAPGAPGQLTLNADFDLKKLADDLPHLLDLQEGVKLTSGTLHNVTTVTLQADRAIVNQQLDITELKGTNQNKPVAAQPIHLTVAGATLGGQGPVPDLRDFALSLKSGFATIDGNAPTIANLKVTGNIDLAAAQREIGQFTNLGKSALAGTTTFTITTDGDLTKQGGVAQGNVTLAGKDIRIENLAGHTLVQPHLDLNAKGQLVRGENFFIQFVRQAELLFKSGDPNRPTVNTRALGDFAIVSANGTTTYTLPRFELVSLDVDLPRAQSEFRPFLTALNQKKLNFTTGTLFVTAEGAFDGTTTTLTSVSTAMKNISLERRINPSQPTPLLSDYSTFLDLDGTMRAAGKTLDVRLTQLSLHDDNRLATITDLAGTGLTASVAENGAFVLNGQLQLFANLKGIDDLMKGLSADPATAIATAKADAGHLESGTLTGTLTMAQGQQDSTDLIGDFALNDLSVATQREPIRNQKVTLTLRASAAHDASRIRAQQLAVNSAFANVVVSDADVAPNAASPLDIVRKATLKLDIPDAMALWAVASAFTPAEAGDAANTETPSTPAKGKGKPVVPLAFQSGSFTGSLQLARDDKGLNITIDQFTGKDIAVGRGNRLFRAPQANLALSALVAADTREGTRPLMEQIREIQVPRLEGNLAVGTVQLVEPITLRNPTTALAATGALKIDGELRQVSDLLDALRPVPDPEADKYAGQYTLTQRFSTQGNTVTTTGQLDVLNLSVIPQAAAARRVSLDPAPESSLIVRPSPFFSQVRGDTPIGQRAPRDAQRPTTQPAGPDRASGSERITPAPRQPTRAPRNNAAEAPRNDDIGSQRIGSAPRNQRRAAPPTPTQELTEDRVTLTNDLVLDHQASTLNVRKLDLAMQRTNALALSATALISDVKNARKIDSSKITFSYDLAALSRFIAPMLLPESRQAFLDLQLKGVAKDRAINLAGSYPTDEFQKSTGRVRDPLRLLNANTSLLVEYVNYDGMELESPGEIPVVYDDGKVRIAHPGRNAKPVEPLAFSGGKIDLGGLVLSVLTKHVTVETDRRDYKLIDSVQIGPEFFESYLADLHPLFSVPKNSNAVATVVVNQLEKMPIDRSLLRDRKSNSEGRGVFTISLTELHLDSPAMDLLASQLKWKRNDDGTVSGNIKDAKITMEPGRVRSDLALDLGGQSIGFRNASVNLARQEIENMTMALPKEMLPFVREQRFLQPIIQVPMSGPLTRPKFDIIQAALKTALPGSPQDLLQNLEGLLGGNRDREEAPGRNNAADRDRDARDRDRESPPPGTIGRPR